MQEDVEVARRGTARTSLALTRQADAGTFVHAGRDVDRQTLGLVHAPFATTGFTRAFDHLTCAMAGRTGAFDHEKALLRAHLTMAFAGAASLDPGAWLRA